MAFNFPVAAIFLARPATRRASGPGRRLVVHPPQSTLRSAATPVLRSSTATEDGEDGCYGGRAGLIAARGTKAPTNEPNEDKLWFDPF